MRIEHCTFLVMSSIMHQQSLHVLCSLAGARASVGAAGPPYLEEHRLLADEADLAAPPVVGCGRASPSADLDACRSRSFGAPDQRRVLDGQRHRAAAEREYAAGRVVEALRPAETSVNSLPGSHDCVTSPPGAAPPGKYLSTSIHRVGH